MGRFVCAANKGLTTGEKRVFGVSFGSAHSEGLSGFWRLFTTYGTAESEFSQWLICSKTGKKDETLTQRAPSGAQRARKRALMRLGLEDESHVAVGVEL